MRHVLVPLDDSEQAWEALEHAMWTFPDAEVTVLTVIDPTAGFPSGMAAPASAEVWYDSARERAEGRLEEARRRAAEAGVDVDPVVETGRPARTIVGYAEEHDVDAVVMGSHGRNGVVRVLLGSVAETVVRRSPVPVTVVR
jgi:nucleotide-binding universal stress UspA family protein